MRGRRRRPEPRPSAGALRRRGRLIVSQPALPRDPVLARAQMETLLAWLRRRWPCPVHPVERVELDIARAVVGELALIVDSGLERAS